MVKMVNYEKASEGEVNDESEPRAKDYKRSLRESLGLPNQLLKGDLREEEEYEKSLLPFLFLCLFFHCFLVLFLNGEFFENKI